MKTFDSWFKKKFRGLHESILCGDMVAANYKKLSKQSYEAGKQSRQAEIDNLKKSFGVCCSNARDILDAYYQGRFVLVNERDLEKFL